VSTVHRSNDKDATAADAVRSRFRIPRNRRYAHKDVCNIVNTVRHGAVPLRAHEQPSQSRHGEKRIAPARQSAGASESNKTKKIAES